MHTIVPFDRWLSVYDSSFDERSPFYGKEYNYDVYAETIYGYYIDPAWDFFGSETLYVKILFAHYGSGFAILELIGEWNDTLYNDIMTFKRDFLELLQHEGIDKFILMGENIFNFHGSDDSYYEEWFDELDDGWIAAINFPLHVQQEMSKYGIDRYINMGGTLEIENWRTFKPLTLCHHIESLINRRLLPG